MRDRQTETERGARQGEGEETDRQPVRVTETEGNRGREKRNTHRGADIK